MKLEEYLGIWKLNRRGDSISLDYGVLCRKIEKFTPDEPAYRIVEQLEAEDYIETLSNGNRRLTAKGVKNHTHLPMKSVIQPAGNEAAWDKFRRICHYYIDCVQQSEKTQEYLFEDSLNNQFLLPRLGVDWWKNVHSFPIPTSDTQRPAVNKIKTRKDNDEDVLIGYPLNAFKISNGSLAYTPVFLVPVDVTFDSHQVYLKIRHDEIDINRTWLKFNVRKEEQKSCLEGICYTEGSHLGLINFDVALQYLANRFKKDLNPNMLNPVLNGEGILNSAALFVGTGLKFSKTLKKELKLIANQPADVLDQTALAYTFRTPPLENVYANERSYVPLDFLPSNCEQNQALNEALNKPASKVTGPPGTGKSQVAVNIIANLVYHGKSVLFTSKNHKAIHAIIDKSNDAVPNVNLVQFCTNMDSSEGAAWYKQDIESEVGKYWDLQRKLPNKGELAVRKTDDGCDDLRDCQSEVDRVENLRVSLQDINGELEFLETKAGVPPNEITNEFRLKLEKLSKKIFDVNEPRSFLVRIVDLILHRKKTVVAALEEIRKMVPSIAGIYNSAQTIKKRVDVLCGNISNYLVVKSQVEKTITEAKSLPDYKELLDHLTKAYVTVNENILNAFIAKRSKAVLEMSDDAKQKLKNATNMIAHQNLSFLSQIISDEVLREAQNAFVDFSRYFPAWACTLLSLTKASPCVAGLFDRVVIDEASQCEIPPLIPALFRARGVTVIGDPAQFPPVITMRQNRHAYIRFISHKLSEVEDERYDFTNHSAYDMLDVHPVLLREHFRCNQEICEYFNSEYYQGKLKVRTDPQQLNYPSNMGFKRGLVWQEVSSSKEGEIQAIKDLLQQLAETEYKGSIGIITPFRQLANDLKTKLQGFANLLNNFNVKEDVNTVNGFQGGERDLIILQLALNDETTRGQNWYAASDENRYIYNVAASRARACLIIVGDREKALQSSSSALRNLAKPPRSRPSVSESPGESKLYAALCEAGYAAIQQYALAGRYLDMALVDEKIDIEVDSEAYHLNNFGERKSGDVYRDMVIQSTGWRVMRFWYYEVDEDVDSCVAEIRALVERS